MSEGGGSHLSRAMSAGKGDGTHVQSKKIKEVPSRPAGARGCQRGRCGVQGPLDF